jgi:hypothetical protein
MTQVSFQTIGKVLPADQLNLLPMSPVYSVTYVAGQDHPSLLPARGEKEARATQTKTSDRVLAARFVPEFSGKNESHCCFAST